MTQQMWLELLIGSGLLVALVSGTWILASKMNHVSDQLREINHRVVTLERWKEDQTEKIRLFYEAPPWQPLAQQMEAMNITLAVMREEVAGLKRRMDRQET